MTKKEFARKLAKIQGISIGKACKNYDGMVETLKTIFLESEEETITLFGLGRFDIIRKPSRPGVNPKTQEKITLKPKTVVKFSLSRLFK